MSYKIENGDSLPPDEMAFKIVEFYDSKGRKQKSVMYNSEGRPNSGGEYYEYDKVGNILKSATYNLDSTLRMQNFYEYDSKGRQVKEINVRKNEKIIRKSSYNKRNKTEQIYGRYDNGNFFENSVKKFDEDGNYVELISYDSLGHWKSKSEYEYDLNGNNVSYKRFDKENELQNFSIIVFNENNDAIKKYHYKVEGNDTILDASTTNEYTYDQFGNTKEIKLYKSGEMEWLIKYRFEYDHKKK